MLLVLSEEHKEHLSFLTKVDIEGKPVSSSLSSWIQWLKLHECVVGPTP